MSDAPIDYATWGERFFIEAVTLGRVLDGVNVLAGRPIDIGPLGVGPGRMAKVHARGRIGTATGRRTALGPLVFEVTLPVDLTFTLDLGMDKQRFDAAIVVPLSITARARADLAIALEVTPPSAAEVSVDLRARGLRAALTGRAANIEGELRRFVARYVARELDQDYVRAATVIDVAGAVDRAAAQVAPRSESPIADELTEALPQAFEDEIGPSAHLLLTDEPLPDQPLPNQPLPEDQERP